MFVMTDEGHPSSIPAEMRGTFTPTYGVKVPFRRGRRRASGGAGVARQAGPASRVRRGRRRASGGAGVAPLEPGTLRDDRVFGIRRGRHACAEQAKPLVKPAREQGGP
jgi:hypothetical protein